MPYRRHRLIRLRRTALNSQFCAVPADAATGYLKAPDRRLHVRVLDAGQLRFVTCWTDCGGPVLAAARTVLMPGAGTGILKTWKPAGPRTAAYALPWTCIT